MPINIEKHIRQHPSEIDGVRILITRWWPRGVAKKSIDNWLQVLAPSAELLRAYWDDSLCEGSLNPVQKTEEEMFKIFADLYAQEMGKPEADLCIRGLAQELIEGSTISLLCGCHSPQFCHRLVLKKLILEKKENLNEQYN